MPETAHNHKETNSRERLKTVDYDGGTVDYSVVGTDGEHNPVVIVPGFTIGRLVQRNFASTLSREGSRQVIFSEQPDFTDKALPLDNHAEALLAILQNEGLSYRPVDFVTHSMGSLIFARAAELAKERGLSAFDKDGGSRAVFIAPAGSNAKENLIYLGGRFANFMAKARPYDKELDPTGDWMKEGASNFLRHKSKTAKEVLALSKKEKIYQRLGSLGIKPFIIGYSNDSLFPHSTFESTVNKHGETIEGYAVPVDTLGVGAKDFAEFMAKTGLQGKDAKRAWAHHYRNAGHNDLLFHPERTVNAILPILDGNMLERSKEAERNYQKAKVPKAKITL